MDHEDLGTNPGYAHDLSPCFVEETLKGQKVGRIQLDLGCGLYPGWSLTLVGVTLKLTNRREEPVVVPVEQSECDEVLSSGVSGRQFTCPWIRPCTHLRSPCGEHLPRDHATEPPAEDYLRRTLNLVKSPQHHAVCLRCGCELNDPSALSQFRVFSHLSCLPFLPGSEPTEDVVSLCAWHWCQVAILQGRKLLSEGNQANARACFMWASETLGFGQ